MSARIHPTALVNPDAKLADDVVVGPYCVIDGAVTIGAGCELRPFVRVCDYVTLGKGCTIFENTVLGAPPQDRGFGGEVSSVVVGDHTVLRENVTVHRATGEGNITSIGSRCLIMEGVHLGHNVVVGDDVTISSKAGLAGYVQIGDGVVVGGMAGFHQFVRVGKFCMVGGASKTTQDVPPFMLVDSSPTRIYGLNTVGLRRRGFSGEERALIKECYKTIYRSGLLLRDALRQAREQWGDRPELAPIFDFFAGGDGKRGFCAWPGQGKRD